MENPSNHPLHFEPTAPYSTILTQTTFNTTTPPNVAPRCVLCDEWPANLTVEAGSFCLECCSDARGAAGSVSSPSVVDTRHSEQEMDLIMAENTTRNRRVNLLLPQPSFILQSELEARWALCVLRGEHHGTFPTEAGRFCQACWGEVANAEIRTRRASVSESTQAAAAVTERSDFERATAGDLTLRKKIPQGANAATPVLRAISPRSSLCANCR